MTRIFSKELLDVYITLIGKIKQTFSPTNTYFKNGWGAHYRHTSKYFNWAYQPLLIKMYTKELKFNS
jgi:hypothetical protein